MKPRFLHRAMILSMVFSVLFIVSFLSRGWLPRRVISGFRPFFEYII